MIEEHRLSEDQFSIDSLDPLGYEGESSSGPLSPTAWKPFLHELIYGYTGIKLLLVAHMFGSAMTAVTKVLEAEVDPPMHALQVIFIRMLITYVSAFIYMWSTKVPDFVLGPPEVRHWLILRGLVGFAGLFGLYYSLLYLPLSDAVVLTFLSPIVTGICAWMFLREPFTRTEAIGALISLTGVFVISRPTFLLPGTSSEGRISEKQRALAVAVAMIGVLGAGLVIVVIRNIGFRAHALISVSYFSLWSTIVSFFALVFLPGVSFVLPTAASTWGLMFLMGVLGFIFQFLLTSGIQRTKAGKGASMAYTQVIWAILCDKWLFNRVPDVWSVLGGMLILGSAMWVAVSRSGEPTLRSISTTSLEAIELDNDIEELRYDH